MPRSPSTGVFTRVDNSFSNPVFGTVIDPADAIEYYDDIDEGLTFNDASPLILIGSTSGVTTIEAADTASGTIVLPAGSTDFSATGGTAQFVRQDSAGAPFTVTTVPASGIANPQALTRTDDTNVTLTLGGTPSTALLQAVSLTMGWTGVLSLARGGTNANLTASNGGLLYSTASELAILAGTATAGQIPRSGSSSAPSWSTATYPDTAVAGGVLVSASANTISATRTPTFGVAGTATGTLSLAGLTSGTVTIQPQSAAGTYNFNLPTAAGTAGQPLLSGGGGSNPQTYGTLGIAGGGTAATSFTAYAVVCGGTTGTGALQSIASVGSAGNVLMSNGAGSLPTMQGLTTSITFIIDGGGATITTGIKGDLTIPFGWTVTEWTLLGDQSGSIVVDIWKDTYANYPPTVADSITAAAKPTISTATKGQSSTLTAWTTTGAAGETLRFNVDSVTSLTRCTLSLKVTRTTA